MKHLYNIIIPASSRSGAGFLAFWLVAQMPGIQQVELVTNPAN